jgi:hypothetical protein
MAAPRRSEASSVNPASLVPAGIHRIEPAPREGGMNTSTQPIGIRLPKPRLALAALACTQLVTALDFNIVYVALPEICSHLGFSAQSQQWAFSVLICIEK